MSNNSLNPSSADSAALCDPKNRISVRLWSPCIWLPNNLPHRTRTTVTTRKTLTTMSLSYARISGNDQAAISPDTKVTCDLRSDTVTQPCKGMIEAMISAPLGDDVYSDDPTVNKLESHVAALCGKEAAIFVATGTMSNQLAIRAQLGAMDSIICDARCHIYKYECGGVAYHTQATLIPVHHSAGNNHLTVENIEPEILSPDICFAPTKMICLENTLSGSVFPLEDMQKIKAFAETRGLLVHIDGARLWSACVATGHSLQTYAACADTVSLCLSKTLGAPIGSVLVGSKAVIDRARLFRKVMGGGWRQAGLLAAAALYAIETNGGSVLQDVHARANFLGEGLTRLGFKVNEAFGGVVETNMVFANMSEVTKKTGLDWADLAAELLPHGIKIFGPRRGDASTNRLVLHPQTSVTDIQTLLTTVETCLAKACAHAKVAGLEGGA